MGRYQLDVEGGFVFVILVLIFRIVEAFSLAIFAVIEFDGSIFLGAGYLIQDYCYKDNSDTGCETYFVRRI
ncbi:hypothetical protein [Fibrobacter sp. UWEL]|uniref:hypothetical protein n=1 Tax=Fibrobacter sp. UWEL TaxID=1896209 RepID=UPI00090F38F4|nr:hypothetical protein [Fibrobacter sp. UWEL]SHL52188.1 hypothetical protein SAMN05720468_1387 [Fibrobacter sp. UWEL]